jgi:hypothetical protein
LLWDHRTPPLNWLVGDHTIVCVETEVAPDASLYVQFWCEPQEPVLWEVSSGHANPGARPFVKGEPARRLRAMGFRIGGAARNFCRQVSVGNRGDAAQVAGEVLRIYYEALGYRGRTPLVVHADRCRRSTSAPVLTGVTAEDVQKLLVRAGFSATIAEAVKGCPRLAGSHGELPFDVTLDARDEETGLYTAVDVDAAVGAFGDSDTLVFMNVLNSSSRVGSTWIAPKDRAVILGTSLLFAGGLTEAHIVERLQAWLRMVTRTMLDLAPTRARAKKGGKGGKGKKAAAGGRAGRQAARGAAGAGDTAVSGSRLVH